MRDTLVQNPKYFPEFISLKDQLISESNERINSDQIDPENLPNVQYRIFLSSLEKLIAMYSGGKSFDVIKTEYSKTLNLIEQGWDDTVVKFKMGRPQVIYDKYSANHYCYMIWMISLAILLRVSEKEITILKTIIREGNIDDELIHFLLQDNFQNPTKNSYKPFKSLLAKNIEATSKNVIKKYLDKWFQNTSILTWHNYKISIETSKYHYGYWCFEAAAVVAILDLDDSSFRENQYYPKDLVDYYRSEKG